MICMLTFRPYTSSDLQAYLSARHVTAEIIYCDIPTPTVEAAAEAMGRMIPRRLPRLRVVPTTSDFSETASRSVASWSRRSRPKSSASRW